MALLEGRHDLFTAWCLLVFVLAFDGGEVGGVRGEGRGADGRTDVVFGKEVGMHCDGGRWSGGFSEEGKKVACDTGRVVVVVVVELGPELFPRQVLRLPQGLAADFPQR